MNTARTQLPEQLPAPFGRYRLLKLLGKGGMGSVYLAQDTQLDRPVALKVPLLEAESGSHILQRFYTEARAAAALHHPNICPIHDVGEIEGTPYLTMAYVEGKPLGEFVRLRPLLPRQSAALIRKLALALSEAHKHGVIHRDLKPANIMIDKRGEPVIMDFGLARRTHKGDVRVTQEGAAMGTPAYMPPEQVQGKVDVMGPACDIYSLGVILYELLAGRLPFSGNLMSVLSQVLMDEPPPPSQFLSDLEPALEAICLKAMAKKVEGRYSSMAVFAGALAEFLRGKPAGTATQAPAKAATSPPAHDKETEPEGIRVSQMGGFRSVANLHADLERTKRREEPTKRSAATVAVAGKKSRKKKGQGFWSLAKKRPWVFYGVFAALIIVPILVALWLSGRKADSASGPIAQSSGSPQKPSAGSSGAGKLPYLSGEEKDLSAKNSKPDTTAPKKPETRVVPNVKLVKPEDAEDVQSTPPPPGAIVLFDGTNLDSWGQARKLAPAMWLQLPSGAMQARGGDIKTIQVFAGRFKLHVEFRVPYLGTAKGQARGNSGIFLLGRHELQILDSYGLNSRNNDCGAIYGLAAPLVNACKAPTVWQSYDIDFQGPTCKLGQKEAPAQVTIFQNGIKIHDQLRITTDGTIGGLGGDPCAPGPIMLQDHGNPVEFRNIWLQQDPTWLALFNGRDLSGWERVGGGNWTVADGVLRGAFNAPGWLATERDYGDFDLSFEYRLSPKGNSGVFVHAWGDAPVNGGRFCEIQLIDDQGYNTFGRFNGTGSIFGVLAPTPPIRSIPGVWHKLAIRSLGRQVQVAFEGRLVLGTNLDSHAALFERFPGLQRTTGRIGLQQLGGVVEFRNVQLRSLP